MKKYLTRIFLSTIVHIEEIKTALKPMDWKYIF